MCRRQHSQNSRSVSEKRNDGVSAYHSFTSSVAVPFPEAISPAKPSNNFFTLHLQWTYSVTHRTEFSVRSKQRYGKRILLTLSAAARERICGIVPHRHSFKLNDLIFDAVFSVEEFRIAGLICFFQREKFPLMPAVDKPNPPHRSFPNLCFRILCHKRDIISYQLFISERNARRQGAMLATLATKQCAGNGQ